MSHEIKEGLEQIANNLRSPYVEDANLEPSNVVDVLDDCAHALYSIAHAIRGLHPQSNVVKTKSKNLTYVIKEEGTKDGQSY